jgi:hypothetical protein
MKYLARAILSLLALGALTVIGLLVFRYHPTQHWLAFMTGSENTSGAPPNYNFWSGFGSDLGEVTILVGMYAVYKKHNCGVKWCWRFSRHAWTDDKGLTHMLCRRHHPDHSGRPITADEICEQVNA